MPLIGLAVFAATLLLYLATLTEVHTFDALSYVLDVDRKPLNELFHPHHLAYGPFGALIRAICRQLGLAGSVLVPLQLANAFAGALGTTLFYLLVYRLTGRHGPAVAGALLLGASYAYWYYAVEVEVYTIAALFLIVALGLILALAERPAAHLALLLGCVQGLALLFHQTNLLLSLVALVAIGSAVGGATGGYARRNGLWLCIAYGSPLILIVGGSYLWVGLGISGFRSWQSLYGWMAGYATTGWWGGPPGLQNITGLGKGLSETLARPAGMVIGLLLLTLLLGHARGLLAYRRAAIILGSWLLSYGAFFFWWEADNSEFWIASLPPFYLLLILAIDGQTPTGEQRPAWARRLVTSALLAIGLVMLATNFRSIERRGDATTDLQRRIAQELARRTAEGDLLLVPDGLQELYLPYYEGRNNVFSLNQALFARGGDWPAACGLLRERIELAIAGGFGLLISNEAINPLPARAGDPPTPLERFELQPEQVAQCYQPYLAMLEPADLPDNLPAYQRIVAAQQLADGAGWDFRRGRWGWRSTGVEQAQDAAGWQIAAGFDPALLSPPITIDLASIQAIEIRMAAASEARDGQIFFLDAQGQADEQHSIRWTLERGEQAVTYRLAIDRIDRARTVGGLRIDPVGVGDGDLVRIEWIRLIR